MTDRQLLVRAATGDEPAFTILHQRYAGRLYGYFLHRTGRAAEADDLTQQVFLNLLESKAFQYPEEGPDDLSPLLFTIAANLLKNAHRSRERKADRETAFAKHQPGFTTVGATSEKDHRLANALARLPEKQRVCVDLRFRRGLSVAEIAMATDCAPGTVKSRLHYGLRKLASLLQTSVKDLP
ncbi:RNA polymerase sigma factor [Neolewinella antarctica]|uniref:RNA polymerase sigma-70 factor (ECF subfamily) n=1 Tax=Neolewinella antarctica TaxID=442734 RepID=A0ABX0XE70_9BACT|nr:RNA polymerase sigma factor [Neolewinella antarctica]NJC27093.1 RNA polymerase sigma-70 factor (ECF subfamily) [Neolewinella antarctica]